MKILLLNTNDLQGGAARAAYRLHQGLLEIGSSSSMLVQNKTSDRHEIIGSVGKIQKGLANMRPTIDVLPLQVYRQRDRTPYNYSVQWLEDKIIPQVQKINPDIINLHWICGGFIKIETLSLLNKPLVWTLHDMWGFTGGCHYSGGCLGYLGECGNCPLLKSNRDWDLSRWIWKRKNKAWKNIDLTIVTPSKWLGVAAQKSSLFKNCRIEIIPNGINPQIYKPIDRQIARNILGLPQDKILILFGASGKVAYSRKGFDLLQSALKILKLSIDRDSVELLIFGSSKPEHPPDFGFSDRYLGKFGDEVSLSLLYSAVDTFVAPSKEDNLPNTIVEAMGCGTPCVGFQIGGISDLIEHKVNGYLAQPFDTEDLARGISWVIEENRDNILGLKATNKIHRLMTQKIQAQSYLKLFEELVDRQKNKT